jgi:hypothetical protein
VNGEKVTDLQNPKSVSDGMILKIGKRRIVRLKTS